MKDDPLPADWEQLVLWREEEKKPKDDEEEMEEDCE